jgi:hypothetical protein
MILLLCAVDGVSRIDTLCEKEGCGVVAIRIGDMETSRFCNVCNVDVDVLWVAWRAADALVAVVSGRLRACINASSACMDVL